MGELLPRNTCYRYVDGYRYTYTCTSAWYLWVRWVIVGVVLVFSLIAVIIAVICINRRQKRQRQRYAQNSTLLAPQPTPAFPPQEAYYPQQPGGPPTYAAPNTGFYGQPQQAGVTQPQGAYQPPKW